MSLLLVSLPGNEAMTKRLAEHMDAEISILECRSFPDGESYLRYRTEVEGKQVVIVCTLDRPNEKLLPLVFAASTARDLGAVRIGLVTPYLAYMRQDRRFQPGEALTSEIFARWISSQFDWLVTVDPHLHRRSALSDIYEIPASKEETAPLFASWIAENVNHPLLIGPDEESEQWVGAIARACGASHLILEKTRKGDRDVVISIPTIADLENTSPVLVDDIISTGHTMIETLRQLQLAGAHKFICMGVHGIFAEGAYEKLLQAGAGRVVTANTITHESNVIDVSKEISEAIGELLV